MPIEKFNLPVGRLVGGNPAIPQKKTNFQTGKEILDEKTGQPIIQYRCEIAYTKDVFMREIWPLLVRLASEAYPINPQTGSPNVSRDFSWKVIDGDSPEVPKNSKTPYNQREGYPGHYILKISTEAFAPKVVKRENGAFHTLTEKDFKVGDYLVANVDMKVHTNNDGGIYINPNIFELVGQGTAIATMGGANPEQVFGGQNFQLPPGAQPLGSMPQVPNGAPAYPQPVAQGYSAPSPAMPPMVPQSAPVGGGMPAPSMGYATPVGAPMPTTPAYAPPMATPAAPLPAPATGFAANAGAPAYPQPVAPGYAPNVGAAPLPGAPLPAGPTAMPATSYPSSPGMPPLPVR